MSNNLRHSSVRPFQMTEGGAAITTLPVGYELGSTRFSSVYSSLYSPYVKTVLEMVSFGSQTRATHNTLFIVYKSSASATGNSIF